MNVLRLPIKTAENIRHHAFKGYAFFSKPWFASVARRREIGRRKLLYRALNSKATWNKLNVVIDLDTWLYEEVEAFQKELSPNDSWVENAQQRKCVRRIRSQICRYQRNVLWQLAKVAE